MLVSQGIIIKYLSGGGGGELTCTPKSMGVPLGQRGTGCSTRTLASDELTCTPKSTGVQLGQRGTGCSTRTLASAGSNCSDTTKNPKMTRKEEAQFLLPPSPHTHIPAKA